MKKICFILASFLAFSAANAQIGIGPELSFNMSKLTLDTKTAGVKIENSMSAKYKFGIMLDIPVAEDLSVQTGLFYNKAGGHQKITAPFFDTSIGGFPINISANADVKTNLNYFQLPVGIVYRIGHITVGAGGYFGYALSGTVKGTATVPIPILGFNLSVPIDSTITFGSDSNSIKQIDFGANINAGYEFPFGLYVRAFYSVGFANLANREGDKAHNSSFGISVGYLLRKKK